MRARDRDRARAISGFLGTVVDGAPPVLEALMPELRGYLGTAKSCSYGVSIGADGCDVSFGHGDGFAPGASVAWGMGHWIRGSRGRWGLYDAARVERDQQNRVITTSTGRQIMSDAVEAAAAGRETHEALGTLDDHQLRVLVCDGPRLLAWVGGLQPDRFAPVQEQRLRALIPALRRRLLLEARLETSALCAAAMPVILERVAGTAFLVAASGRVHLANTAGRARYDRDPGGTTAALREAICRPRATGPEVTPLAVEGAPPCYLVIDRPPAKAPEPRVQAAARRHGLTPRESEVLLHLVQGGSNRAIALTLGCAERTVEVHVAHLLDKVGAPSRSALVARFWMDG